MNVPDWDKAEKRGFIYLGNLSIPDRVKYIEQIAARGANSPVVITLAKRFENYPDRYKRLFDYIHKNVPYYPDPENSQYIRYPHRTLRERKGNCVDYSALLSSVLQRWRVPHHLRVIMLNTKNGYQHIYPVVDRNSIALDCVIGQKEDGTETLQNRPRAYYNSEISYIAKKDYPVKIMRTYALGNINTETVQLEPEFTYSGVRPTIVMNGTRRSRRKAAYAIMQGRGVSMGCTQVYSGGLGVIDPATAAAVANAVLGDKCKRKCDITHAFNKDKRLACKCACGSEEHCVQAGQAVPPSKPSSSAAPAPEPAAKKSGGLVLPIALVSLLAFS